MHKSIDNLAPSCLRTNPIRCRVRQIRMLSATGLDHVSSPGTHGAPGIWCPQWNVKQNMRRAVRALMQRSQRIWTIAVFLDRRIWVERSLSRHSHRPVSSTRAVSIHRLPSHTSVNVIAAPPSTAFDRMTFPVRPNVIPLAMINVTVRPSSAADATIERIDPEPCSLNTLRPIGIKRVSSTAMANRRLSSIDLLLACASASCAPST